MATGLAAGLLSAGSFNLQAQVEVLSCPTGFSALELEPFPPPPMPSLKSVTNSIIPKHPATGAPTLRADLADYVASLPDAIRLGKALFWDMQVGSDNKTACASCHFHAGADRRERNQVNPGANGTYNGFSPNSTFGPQDFPFTTPTTDTDDIAGSQGVRLAQFKGIDPITGAELTESMPDPVFHVGDLNIRRVTGLNAPSVINAVFNHRNFWNGRAQPDFNGVNPFGSRDTSARVWQATPSGVVPVSIIISNASLASQAMGPVLNPVEMSADGRTFADLGKKLLLSKPLGLQKVSPTDSLLGAVAAPTTGLTATYREMIERAFQPKWWNSRSRVSVNGQPYSLMEANFSLFWGLSLMLYQATLVADDTPMDQYLASRVFDPITFNLVSHKPELLDPVVRRLSVRGSSVAVTRDMILHGLELFEQPVAPPPSFPAPRGAGLGCIDCHFGAETTTASIQNITGLVLEPGEDNPKLAGFDRRLERMFTRLDWDPPGAISIVPQGADTITYDPNTYEVNVIGISGKPVRPINLPVAVYDGGFYNIGVRPTSEDPGVDALDPFGKPLSWARLFQALPDPSVILVPGGSLGCIGAGDLHFPDLMLNQNGLPLLAGPLRATEKLDVAGSFKTSQLRNVELTGPYFHNGGKSTLKQVIEFYDEGGDFDNPTLAPAIVPLRLSAEQENSLIAFLLALTDERVRWERAPFDHPQIFVPNGVDPEGTDAMLEIPAVGAAGASVPLQRFLNLNPFQP